MVDISIGVIAEMMGVSRTTAQSLVKAEIFGAYQYRGNRRVVPIEAVQSVASRPLIEPSYALPFVVLRKGKILKSDEFEWKETWTDQEKLDEILRGSTRLRPESVSPPIPLVVCLGPIVVRVYTLTALKRIGGRSYLTLSAPSKQAVKAFEDKRLILPAGPIVVRLPASGSPR